ncbi:hypothetical protein L1887_58897 [Cichorium endivia]|nr:hypothetical protein L1887_58897 [Cichorium endivia]
MRWRSTSRATSPRYMPPDHLFKDVVSGSDGLAVELVVEDGDGQRLAVVVESSPFGVDDHVCDGALGGLELGDFGDVLEVGAVGTRAEDGADQSAVGGVGVGEEGTHGVVDERAALDLDVLAVERILQELDDVLARSVGAVEALGPVDEVAAVDGGLLDGEAECEAEEEDVVGGSGAKVGEEVVDAGGHVVEEVTHGTALELFRDLVLFLLDGEGALAVERHLADPQVGASEVECKRSSCDYSLKLWRARRSEREADEQGSREGGSKSADAKSRKGWVGSGHGSGGAQSWKPMQAGEPELGNDGAALPPDVLTERTDKKVERADAPKGKRLLQSSADESEIPLSRLELGGTQGRPSEEPSPTQHRAMQAGHASHPGTIRQAAASLFPSRLYGVNLAHNNARQQKCPRDVGGRLRPLSVCSTQYVSLTTAVRRIQKRGGPTLAHKQRCMRRWGPSYGKIGIVRPLPIQIGDA